MAASVRVVDLTNVKDQGEFSPRRVMAGDYLAKITDVKDGEAKSDQGFQYIFTFVLQSHSQNKYPYYCKLQENQLWKLRNLAVAAGLNIPKKRVKFDPNKVVGKVVGVTMEDDEYEGKEKSVIASVFPASELSEGSFSETDAPDEDEDEAENEVDYSTEDEAEEEEPDEVEEETEEGDAFDDMDRAALKKYIQGNDAAFTFKKSQSDDDLREVARGFANAGDDDEDEEEEEEPPPPPVKKATKKATAKKKAAPVVDDDELEELDIEDI